MKNNVWMNTLAWVAAVLVALSLAIAAPSETLVMGKLPTLVAKRLDQQLIHLPAGFAAERTLALIGFSAKHRPDVESWIDGLQLDHDRSIPWVRMPVLNDPGNAAERDALEEHLRERYTDVRSRESVVAVVTQRDAFVRAAGLGSTDQMVAAVINRNGDVLARAVGRFDPDKAQALRETLFDHSF
ncbi:MAG TPA: hypothetical protein VLJ57_14185 [Burkholderiaceae bacterium]|nr:hypothetical protein [Burkholderiaceae bacterium]